MMPVVLLQKYLSPYRVPLFNAIAATPGIDLTVLYYGAPEERRRWTVFPGKAFAEAKASCLTFRGGYERNIDIPWSLPRELHRLRPEAVVCAPDAGGIAAWFHVRSRRGRLVVWSEAIPSTETGASHPKRRLRSTIYGAASAFAVPGELSERYIREFRPDARFFRTPNTTDEKLFAATPAEVERKFSADGPLLVTFSGSLIERKGTHILVPAFRRLLDEEPSLRGRVQLRLLGTGPLDLTGAAGGGVDLLGFREGEAYSRTFRESHLFVLPSLRDNNPLTVVEALFAGNALLLSEGCGNHPEAVRGNGTVVPAGSAERLFGAMRDLLLRPRAELAAMAQASLLIASEFSVERSAGGFRAALDACVP